MVPYQCPRCGGRRFRKVRRKRWMRLIPFSDCWECRECYSKYVTFLGIVIWHNYYR